MHSFEKWPDILQISYGAHMARILKYVQYLGYFSTFCMEGLILKAKFGSPKIYWEFQFLFKKTKLDVSVVER